MKSNEKDKEKVATNFWKNVSAVLKEKNLKWKWLAEQLGLDQRTISSLKASNSNLGINRAHEIAELLEVSLDYLLSNDRAPRLVTIDVNELLHRLDNKSNTGGK